MPDFKAMTRTSHSDVADWNDQKQREGIRMMLSLSWAEVAQRLSFSEFKTLYPLIKKLNIISLPSEATRAFHESQSGTAPGGNAQQQNSQ